ncbi:unnamed protein product [Schistocephalus solidus]|uniref:Uncharacterized protein n=1 Tax=Schistocephalus solidus TaxID=70667 RepID=A0A183SJV5_SCHSO|nr:unnamed protein product [Schistocephalus solidus]
MGSQHSYPFGMVCTGSGGKFTKENELIRLRHSCQEGMQVIAWFFLLLVGALIRGGVDADDGGENFSSKRQTEAHQTILYDLRQIGRKSHDIVPDDKGDTSVWSLPLSGHSRRKCSQHTPYPTDPAQRIGSR